MLCLLVTSIHVLLGGCCPSRVPDKFGRDATTEGSDLGWVDDVIYQHSLDHSPRPTTPTTGTCSLVSSLHFLTTHFYVRPSQYNMSSALFDMTGYHCLITGAGSGIGAMIAETYHAQGATIYLVGRRVEKLQETKSAILADNSTGKGDIIILDGDVSTRQGIESLVSSYEKHTSHMDVLVSNAGVLKWEGKPWKETLNADEMKEHFLSSSVEDWTQTNTINVTAMWHLSGAFLPHLSRSQHGGSILITSSISGLHWSATTGVASYAASKAAVNHLTKLMANKLRGLYIRVNAIAPGIFPSDMNSEAIMKKHKENGTIDRIPAKTFGDRKHMGSAAVLFATNTYVDGQVLAVDGGRSLTANGS